MVVDAQFGIEKLKVRITNPVIDLVDAAKKFKTYKKIPRNRFIKS